jgi:Tfp pilus assembly protein PilX
MHHPCSVRRENGAALVLSLVLLAVLLVVGSGALTTSRIETQIASSDTRGKQVLLAAEYALAVGESTVQQAGCESGCENALDDTLASRAGRLYSKGQQPAWGNAFWDDRDSMDTKPYFRDPTSPPPMLQDPHDRPRLMVERKYIEYDSLSASNRSGITYVNISAHGGHAQWTALGPTQCQLEQNPTKVCQEDRPGVTNTQITYNDRYPGARVVLQSIYAIRYK